MMQQPQAQRPQSGADLSLSSELAPRPQIHFMIKGESDRLSEGWNKLAFSVRNISGAKLEISALNDSAPAFDNPVLEQAYRFFIQAEGKQEDSAITGYYAGLMSAPSDRRHLFGHPPRRSPMSGTFELNWREEDPLTIIVSRLSDHPPSR